jgi:hypothetical protein
MLSTPPLLPFQRLQRLSPLTQLGDVAISRADSGVHARTQVWSRDRTAALTCPNPPESSPRIPRPSPHQSTSKLALCSRSGHPLSSLVHILRLSTGLLDIAISPFCSALSAFRDLRVLRRLRVRCVLRQSEEAPDTPLGFASAWLEKLSGQLRALRGEFAIVRVSKAFRARVHPTSRSAAAHILQHSDGALALSLDPRLGCAPLRAPLHRSVNSEESVVRVMGLEALLFQPSPWWEMARAVISSPCCLSLCCPERRTSTFSSLVSFFSRSVQCLAEHPRRVALLARAVRRLRVPCAWSALPWPAVSSLPVE